MLRFCIFMAFVLQMNSCSKETNNNHSGENSEVKKVKINRPEFNSDSAFAHIETQLKFGFRVPGTIPHQKCAEWLAAKFKEYKASEVIITETPARTHTGKDLKVKNIIASFQPQHTARIMLTCHWDSRPIADEDKKDKEKPIPAANDAGSGVGVLLEIARLLSTNDLGIGVDIFLWDAEDMGVPDVEDSYCIGSRAWAQNTHKPGYRALYAINLDMVGAKGATFPKEGISVQYAKNVTDKVWQAAHDLGYGAFFPMTVGDPVTDDHLYINLIAKIPAIDVIHKDMSSGKFFAEWHTHNDNISIISKETLKAVGQTMIEVLAREGEFLQ